MRQPIVYIDTSSIQDGKLEELQRAMQHLAGFVEENMPRLISYGFYLDDERSTMTVVAVHPDSESLQYHLDTGREEFRKFGELIELERIDVYGRISDDAHERLLKKSRMLGAGSVNVCDFFAGFAR